MNQSPKQASKKEQIYDKILYFIKKDFAILSINENTYVCQCLKLRCNKSSQWIYIWHIIWHSQTC